jgi:serine/threonine protein kinase/Flp pilus assembly protein TadD
MEVKCSNCGTDNTQDSEFCKKCGTQMGESEAKPIPTQTLEAAKEELTTGSTFADRYQIIEELGRGGMGRVYKATDTKIKEKVALKLIKPEIASDKKTLERFGNELRIARKITHKNVGKMFDINEEGGTHYITMEYVSGQDLKGLIRQSGQLGTGTSLSIAKQVCDGLAEAHKVGVIHRDLKPGNIMIDREGNVRIMDFGIARSLKEKGITGAGVMIGTPEYMSPEQVEGKEVDQRSDIYSLGVILYEMATGRVPFEGDTALTIAVKHKTEEPKNPKEFNTQLSEDLSKVILRCLEKDKDKRYQSAGEVRDELSNIEEGIPTTEQKIPERKPFTSREITVQFSPKKLFVPAAIVVALVIVGAIIWRLLPQKDAIPPLTGKPSLVIMYFENNTGHENLDHYRKAISDLLITDLSQSRHLDVVGGDRLFNILEDLNLMEAKNYSSNALRDVASKGRASHILQGNYTKAEDVFRISVMLHEANTMKRVSSEMFEGTGEKSIFSMVDKITTTIKSSFAISADEIAADIDENIEDITTSFPEALKYYIESRRYFNSGDYRESIPLMEKAVEIDPEFAMAYRSLAMSYDNLGFIAESRKYITKALDLADRLPEKERLQITGDFYGQKEKTYDKAIEAYLRLLELYPEDTRGNHNLAIRYDALEQWDKAIERYEFAKKQGTDFYVTYTALATAYRAKQMYKKAIEALESYITNFGDHAAIHQGLALIYIDQGQLDLALNEADKAFILAPDDWFNFQLKGDIYLYQGDLAKAEEEYQNMLKGREPAGQGYGRRRMSELYLHQGKFRDASKMDKQILALTKMAGQRTWESLGYLSLASSYFASRDFEEALKEYEEALAIARETDLLGVERSSLHLKGLVLLEMNSMAEAQKTANELKTLIEEGLNEKIIRLYYHLAGRIALKKKNYPQAIEQFQKAISLVPFGPTRMHAGFVDSLAVAYFESGDLEKAMSEYERITKLTVGRRGLGSIYAKNFYMLGKIYEQQGNTSKAIENYDKFLDLWKEADPGIAEVEDAKVRLSGLKS